MITLTLILLTLFIIGIIALFSIGALALSCWWIILIIVDVLLAFWLIKIIFFRNKKDKK